jgi:hypothetical protein
LTPPGIRFNEHIEGDGPTVFAHACKMGLEGIVSKRKDSTYRSGRSKLGPTSVPTELGETDEQQTMQRYCSGGASLE